MELNRRTFAPVPDRGPLRVRQTPDPIESYDNRDGYDEQFLGECLHVPLPGLGAWTRPGAIAHRLDDPAKVVLEYRHFSVIHCAARRMPLLSAVNIHGRRSVPTSRTDVWKPDPRIALDVQILQECYGRESEGFFSRGHMTRREDPNWGSAAQAEEADADTFHATNAAPQAQSFNAPIWLGLENHFLQNARDDAMRVSVFTGPVFAEDDPELHGVQIPLRFWKVICFVHDDSGKLTATGYVASQAARVKRLREPQFVFGKYKDWQVPLTGIGALSGLDFSELQPHDPLRAAGARFALGLKSFGDVFTR